MHRVIVIVGVGRSGTSLVQSMLAAHPAIAMLPETGFCRRYVASRRLRALLAKGGKEQVRKILESDERVGRLGLPIKEMVTSWDARTDRDGHGLYASIFERLQTSESVTRVGDKDPRLIEYLGTVRRVLPQADIVHVIRDPRDVLASKKNAAWSRNRAAILHILAGLVQLQMGMTDGRRYFGPHYHELCYETLLREPAATLESLCSRLELPFEQSMLEFQRSAGSLLAEDELSWKKETTGPLLSENWGKWKNVLGQTEAEMIARAFAGQLEHVDCGLEIQRETVNFGQRVVSAIGARVLQMMAAGYVSVRRMWRFTRGMPQ